MTTRHHHPDPAEPPAERASWRLAIDLGTTYTSATVQHDGRSELLMIGGQPRVPSTVAIDDDGTLVAGVGAERVLARAPERAERNPKRRIGDESFLLGERHVSTRDALAAVLSLVATEAATRFGGAPPRSLVLTHPARWGSIRLGRLAEAAVAAGLPEPTLVAEPVAAAWAAATTASLDPGKNAAIYDLGGGTLDIAIVRRVDEGFEVVGPPGGSDRIGGEMFDERLFTHLGEQLATADAAAWEHLRFSTDRTWRRAAHEFREQVRAAKEALSTRTEDTIYLGAPVDRELRLTRDEVAAALDGDIAASISELDATVRRAGLDRSDLDHVFLVGGGSRMPAVANRIGEWLGSLPTTWGDPKSVVAIGALAAADVDGRRLTDIGPTSTVPVTPAAPITVQDDVDGPVATRDDSHATPHRRTRLIALATVGLVGLLAAGGWALAGSGDDDAVAEGSSTTADVGPSTTAGSGSSSTTSTTSSTSTTNPTTTTTASTTTTTSTSTTTTTRPAGQQPSGGGGGGGVTPVTPTTTLPRPVPATTTTSTTEPAPAPTTTQPVPTVPNVIGDDYSNAQQRIVNAGYGAVRQTTSCEPSSQVVDYTPKGQQPLGTVITLITCL